MRSNPKRLLVFSLIIIGFLCAWPAYAETLSVGPGEQFILPSAAAEFALDGDVIEIDGRGDYQGDVVVWKQNNLTLRGVNGRPHLRAAGRSAVRKGIWVIKGNNVTVENIEFSGAKVRDKNGAGIRMEGKGLAVLHCYFHNNENGILAGKNAESDIVVEHSRFQKNGAGDGKSHNIYIGRIRRLELRFNIFREAKVGHNIKSRAAQNVIAYNIIRDGYSGMASYQIDLPNGGYSVVLGNAIQQGRNAENHALIAYGMEGLKNTDNRLYLASNTLVNDRHSGVFVKTAKNAQAWLYNNLVVGKGEMLKGPGKTAFNLKTASPGFVRRMRGDYRLTANSPAINQGNMDISADNPALLPKYLPGIEDPSVVRAQQGRLDVGAFEFTQ